MSTKLVRNLEMKRLRHEEKLTLREIGDRFGVTRACVHKIIGSTGQLFSGARHPTTKSVLEYIENFYVNNFFPPTYRDIVAGCGLSSTSTARYHVKKLKDLSLLKSETILRSKIIPSNVEIKINRAESE